MIIHNIYVRFYTRYMPWDLECLMFLQATSSPLLYSRLAVMQGDTCGRGTGPAMLANAQGFWERIVDPISKIELGPTRQAGGEIEHGLREELGCIPYTYAIIQ